MKKLFLLVVLFNAATLSSCSKHDNVETPVLPDEQPLAIMVDTPGTLSQLLAAHDESVITELVLIGNLNDKDIATLNTLPNLAVLDMEHVNLEVLPKEAFRAQTSLTSVKLPKTLKTIEIDAFCQCSGLISVTIPDSVTSIERAAFYHCDNLADITIPTSVAKIGSYVFDGCTSLSSIVIPDGVTSIEMCTFQACRSLTSVTIPDNVTEIGKNAFSHCTSLTSATIGVRVTSIEDKAFYACSELISIYCKAQTPPSVGADTDTFSYVSASLYVPTGSKMAYAAAYGWKDFKTIVETEF